MAAKVYANGMEVSGKASGHKVIASMPDVCLSPPSPPAGPIPIPYPNFAQASDTTGGSKKVKAGGKEINLKGKSKYKKSKGDEAATRSFGAGLISHSISGAVKHKAGSFDVKVEGSSVVRTLDLTTGNHSNPGDGCMTVDAAGVAPPAVVPDPECVELDNKNTQDKNDLPQRQSGTGNTNTNYNFESGTKNVPSESRTAHSKVAVFHSDPEKYIEGKPASERKKAANPEGKSNVKCSEGGSFRYSGEYFKGGHTEARMVERIFANSNGGKVKGTLTMKIDWQPSSGGQSCAPCEYCHALLCAATKCGLDIFFCTKSNKKEPLDKDKDCEENLDMTDPKAREAMKRKNTRLKRRLDR